MASVSIYLNFPDKTEEAFIFYKTVFGSEFAGNGIMRFSDVPPVENMPPFSEFEKNLVMHVSLPILDGYQLMGSDAPASMGFKVNNGNNVYINIEPDTRYETRELFNALSAGGAIEQELQEMFWGGFYGSCTDKFGIRWMFNCASME